MKNDLLDFCQYILNKWELDTKDIQDRAEKLVKKYGGNNVITTICYGHKDEWESREKAIRYFVECSCSSEGAERERYTTILLQLLNGQETCSDGWR